MIKNKHVITCNNYVADWIRVRTQNSLVWLLCRRGVRIWTSFGIITFLVQLQITVVYKWHERVGFPDWKNFLLAIIWACSGINLQNSIDLNVFRGRKIRINNCKFYVINCIYENDEMSVLDFKILKKYLSKGNFVVNGWNYNARKHRHFVRLTLPKLNK